MRHLHSTPRNRIALPILNTQTNTHKKLLLSFLCIYKQHKESRWSRSSLTDLISISTAPMLGTPAGTENPYSYT